MANMEKLTLASLRNLDRGIAFEAFQRALDACVHDCADRPGLDKAREVGIVMRLAPKVDRKSGTFDDSQILVEAAVYHKVPKTVTTVYTMVPNQQNSLFFRPDEPLDPTAEKIFDEDVVDRERQARETREKEERQRRDRSRGDDKPPLPS